MGTAQLQNAPGVLLLSLNCKVKTVAFIQSISNACLTVKFAASDTLYNRYLQPTGAHLMEATARIEASQKKGGAGVTAELTWVDHMKGRSVVQLGI